MADAYSESEIQSKLGELKDWTRNDDAIERTFRFTAFMEGIEFVNRLARAAEEADHHPDIDIRYTRVKLALTTHSAGGLTELDFDMAAQADQLVETATEQDA